MTDPLEDLQAAIAHQLVALEAEQTAITHLQDSVERFADMGCRVEMRVRGRPGTWSVAIGIRAPWGDTLSLQHPFRLSAAALHAHLDGVTGDDGDTMPDIPAQPDDLPPAFLRGAADAPPTAPQPVFRSSGHPAVAQPPAPAPEADDPQPEQLHGYDLKAERHLIALNRPEGWTPQKDRDLVHALVTGLKLAGAAIVTGMPEIDCLARFRALMPGQSLQDQAAVIRRLQARVPG